jgi:hypothetical protein
MTLAEFKQTLREQFFSLLLDQDAALAAIPKMLPVDSAKRTQALEAIRRTVHAAGKPGGARAERFAFIEKMFGGAKNTKASETQKVPGKTEAPAKAKATAKAKSSTKAKTTAKASAPAKPSLKSV